MENVHFIEILKVEVLSKCFLLWSSIKWKYKIDFLNLNVLPTNEDGFQSARFKICGHPERLIFVARLLSHSHIYASCRRRATRVMLTSYCNSVRWFAAWISPVALTFPSRCGESNLPDSVAAVGGSPPGDISCCAPSIGGQRAPSGVIKMPGKKSSLTPATESIVLIKGELWLSADKSRRRGGVREEDRGS